MQKGDSGGISSFLLQWVVDTATNQAITQVSLEINDVINDAINTMANQLANLAEDAAEAAVKKAIDDAYDSLKGDKGEKGAKGDKGEDGKNGTSFNLVGTYTTLALFLASYPLLQANVGKAALIGDNPKHLWAITESIIGTIKVEDLGDMQGVKGDKGEDANWSIQLRDESNVAIGSPILVEPVAEGVPNLYIQGTDGVVVDRFQNSNTGFTIKAKHPIPIIASGTTNKFLSNDGVKLVWKDKAVEPPKSKILIKSPNNDVWALTITNEGIIKVNKEVV